MTDNEFFKQYPGQQFNEQLIVRNLGLQSYQEIWDQMQAFTNGRDMTTCDEIWLLEHEPVFTQGQAGKPEHLLNPGNIPVIQVDRGGQITYHGPGQLVAYILVDIKRLKIGVRPFVSAIENAVIQYLQKFAIDAKPRSDAPGVYVDGRKICSLGLRIRHGRSYHGLSFNINMDLTPFTQINPCGLRNLEMTQLADLDGPSDLDDVGNELVKILHPLLYLRD